MLVFWGAPARIKLIVFPAKRDELSSTTDALASERKSVQVFDPSDQVTDPYIGCVSERCMMRPYTGLS